MFVLGVVDLLVLAGFDRTAKAVMVRHQHDKYPVRELLRRGWFELYQAYQGKPIFDKVEYIVSFSGLTGTLARLKGCSASEGSDELLRGTRLPAVRGRRSGRRAAKLVKVAVAFTISNASVASRILKIGSSSTGGLGRGPGAST